jgi:hypothetical protein
MLPCDGTEGFDMRQTGERPSYFAIRWELFCMAEMFRQAEDTECLRHIQQNIVNHELRRIAAATEALGAPDFLRR